MYHAGNYFMSERKREERERNIILLTSERSFTRTIIYVKNIHTLIRTHAL